MKKSRVIIIFIVILVVTIQTIGLVWLISRQKKSSEFDDQFDVLMDRAVVYLEQEFLENGMLTEKEEIKATSYRARNPDKSVQDDDNKNNNENFIYNEVDVYVNVTDNMFDVGAEEYIVHFKKNENGVMDITGWSKTGG